MTDVQSPSSIAQSLPFDILQEIFYLCLPSEDNPTLNCQPNPSLAPLLLCHICILWRTAALRMPFIWKSTTFTIQNVRHPDPPFERFNLPKSKRFIAWWEEHILDVAPSLYFPWPARRPGRRRIDLHKLNNTKSTLFTDPLFRAAHHLRLTLTNQELDIICSNQAPFDNLVELRIENFPDSRTPRMALSPFPFSPRLTRLQLSHAESFDERALHIFPWSQLTHLYLPRTIPLSTWRTLLQRCTNLAVMASILAVIEADTPSSPIAIESLRQLVVAFNSIRMTIPFPTLVFPNLTAFRLVNGRTTIHFMTIEVLEELLSSMPALIELHFDWALSFDDEDFIPFDQLHLRDGRGLSAYLPHLQYLVIDFIDPSDNGIDKNIIRFLKSAWLCSGWTSHDASGTRVRRKLEFIVQNSSYFDDQPVPEKIIEGVKAYLEDEWPADAPFDVSIQDEESLKGFGRGIYDVFDEKLPSKGWDEAVDFYTSVL